MYDTKSLNEAKLYSIILLMFVGTGILVAFCSKLLIFFLKKGFICYVMNLLPVVVGLVSPKHHVTYYKDENGEKKH